MSDLRAQPQPQIQIQSAPQPLQATQPAVQQQVRTQAQTQTQVKTNTQVKTDVSKATITVAKTKALNETKVVALADVDFNKYADTTARRRSEKYGARVLLRTYVDLQASINHPAGTVVSDDVLKADLQALQGIAERTIPDAMRSIVTEVIWTGLDPKRISHSTYTRVTDGGVMVTYKVRVRLLTTRVAKDLMLLCMSLQEIKKPLRNQIRDAIKDLKTPFIIDPPLVGSMDPVLGFPDRRTAFDNQIDASPRAMVSAFVHTFFGRKRQSVLRDSETGRVIRKMPREYDEEQLGGMWVIPDVEDETGGMPDEPQASADVA